MSVQSTEQRGQEEVATAMPSEGFALVTFPDATTAREDAVDEGTERNEGKEQSLTRTIARIQMEEHTSSY
jgi:hypothetical protein